MEFFSKIELQKIIEETKPEDVENTLQMMLNHCDKFDTDLQFFLIKDLITISKINSQCINTYSQIIYNIQFKENSDSNLIKSIVLEYVKANSSSQSSLSHVFCLLNKLFNYGVYTIDEIIDLLINYQYTEANYIVFFSFFAQHIPRYQYLSLLFKVSDKFMKEQKLIYNYLENKTFNEVEPYVTFGYHPKSIEFLIKSDDLEQFITKTSETTTKLKISIFEPKYVIERELDVLQFAAYYGASKIFNFLIHNSSEYSNDHNNYSSLVPYAIAGGNNEIINFCKKMGINLIKFLKYAAFFRRNELCEWILKNQTTNIDKEQSILALCGGCETNNIHFCSLIMKISDLPSFGPNSESPIDCCIENESLECFKMLIDYGFKFHPLTLHRTLDKRIDPISLQILKIGSIDPKITDEQGRTVFDIAAESCSYDIAKELSQHRGVTMKSLDIAYANQNYNFLSVFAEIDDQKPESKNPKLYSHFFFFVIIFFIFLLCIILRK